MFVRILKDAHDEGIIDLRRRGNDFEVARAADAVPVADQLALSERKATPPAPQPAPSTAGPRFGMGPRGAGSRGRPSAPPPELFNVGVVDIAEPVAPAAASVPTSTNGGPPAEPRGRRSKGRGRAKAAANAAPSAEATESGAPTAKAKRGGAKKAAPRGGARAKKGAQSEG
jgi:hypothetical protein